MIRNCRVDRRGTPLFQIALARILSARFNYDYQSAPLRGFSRATKALPGEKILGSAEVWDGNWPFVASFASPVHPSQLTAPPGRPLLLRGAFQRFDLISSFSDEIRNSWMKLDAPLPKQTPEDLAVSLHVDAAPQGHHLRPEDHEVVRAMSQLGEDDIRILVRHTACRRLHLFLEAPGHPLIEKLRDLKPVIVSGWGLDQFRELHAFQRVAFSQSEWAWWAAFLGSAREIYFPRCFQGVWSRPEPAQLAHQPWWQGIDLRVPGDDRFIYEW